MVVLDILAAIAIGYGLIKGFSNGLVKELAGLIGIILAIWAGFRLAFIFADYYTETFEVPDAAIPFIAFLTAFILMLILVLLLGRLLDKLLEKAKLSTLNKLAGALFGGLKLAFIMGILIGLIGKSGIVSNQAKKESYTYPYLVGYCEVVTEYSVGLIPAAKNVFKDMDGYFLELKEKRASNREEDPTSSDDGTDH